jgi:hypothetical protein
MYGVGLALRTALVATSIGLLSGTLRDVLDSQRSHL